ncbi:MAG TPA: methyltransferase domain-containing protein [Thermoplasmata archaeon]|nr:methyltransferase domain-containing protein [Thermoplasmata archaeon]
MTDPLPVVEDRMCRASSLNNPLRRWLAPPAREIRWLDPRPGEAVVDLGAGVGYFAPEILRRIGPQGHLTLVDIDSENLEIARESVGSDPRVTYWVGSAAQADAVPSGSADRVMLSLVLCCLLDKSGALSEAWRILRPGGRLLVTYPRWRIPGRRGPSLRVTKRGWSQLRIEHPWNYLANPRSWAVERHLLERPATSPG